MNDTGKDNNGSANRHSDNEHQASPNSIFTIICFVNVPLMLISILVNALVLVSIKRTPSIRSTSTIFLCSLAVSDFLVGVIGQPIYTAVSRKVVLQTWKSLRDNVEVIMANGGFYGCLIEPQGVLA